MKIDFNAEILDLQGKPLVEEGKSITLSTLAQNALLTSYPDERELDGKAKFDRFMIATTVVLGGEQNISIEDVALIKKLVAKLYGPLAVGRAYQLLEGK